MLIFIQKTLGIGKVYTTGKVAQYEVFDLKGVAKIIEIFTQYPAGGGGSPPPPPEGSIL